MQQGRRCAVLLSLLSLAASPAWAGRKLDVTFLFHANQNLVPYGRVGDRASFRGLLTTLRKHPSLKFQIHFSGTLIHDLLWFGDSTLQLIRAGAQEGQFEIFGSTYVQNVMYSTRTDTGDYQFNDHQIKFHRELIEKTFGVSPSAFWNPERVWTQNFVQLLADNGYHYTQVEDHILAASGTTAPIYSVRTTRFNGRELVVFEDDKEFLNLVDGAINSGNITPVMNFLHAKHAEDVLDRYVIGYYQDAEATGLWDYEGRQDPEQNFRNLDLLLSALQQDTLISVTTYQEYLAAQLPTEDLTPIRDGAAAWMGGDAWFAENLDPRFEAMRAVYDSLRTYLDSVDQAIQSSSGNTLAAARLLRHAWFTLCAHQFEFGCHGLQNDVYRAQLQMARTCAVSGRAALEALAPATRLELSDVNRDGVEETVCVTPGQMFVFSPYGGRMLYWFNLVTGDELVGNENFMADYIEPFVHDNKALPLIRGGIETYPWLAGNPVIPEILQWTFIVRKRALNDSITVGSSLPHSLENDIYAITADGAGITCTIDYNGVRLKKLLTPTSDGVTATYRLISLLPDAVSVRLVVQNSFSPDYLGVMDEGRMSLAYWPPSPWVLPSTLGVVNPVKGVVVGSTWTPPADELSGREDVFGLELNQTYVRRLNPGDSTDLAISLGTGSVEGVEEGVRLVPEQVELLRNYPNPWNPQTQIEFRLPAAGHVNLSVYDLLGREVTRLVDEPRSAGRHTATFDGRGLASGVYVYRLEVGGTVRARTMVHLK